MTKKLINKLGIGALGLALAGSLNGCKFETEKVERRWVYMNPEAHENTQMKYDTSNTQITLPTNLVSYLGYTKTYGNAKNPREVSIGGQGAINGMGYDFNEDGIFDKLEKNNQDDNFTFTELEKILNEVKEKAKNVVDQDMISESFVIKKEKTNKN